MYRGGTTITNIIVIIVCIVLISVIHIITIPPSLNSIRLDRDKVQLAGVTSAFSIYQEYDLLNQFPVPGKINTLPFEYPTGVMIFLGNTPEELVQRISRIELTHDKSINLSAWIHSYMIGFNYYEPDCLISANETNPLVVAKGDLTTRSLEVAYDYLMVEPASGTYWDPLFSGDVSGQGLAEGTIEGGVAGVCHVSYANMALCGERLNYWKSGDHRRVIMSSRGPEDGANIGDDFTKSPTLQLYGDSTKWEGVYVTADGATHFTDSLWFDGLMYKPLDSGTAIPDNAFSAEFNDYENTESLGNLGGASGDTWMVLNVASTATDVKTAWDKLLP